MNFFVVVFDTDVSVEAIKSIVDALQPDTFFQIQDRILLVQSPVSDPRSVAATLGISGTEGSTVGALFKLNGAYYGYYDEALWSWLRERQTA